MNKRIIAFVLCILLSISFLSACSSDKNADKDDNVSTATNVNIYTVGQSNIQNSAAYSGELTAAESVSISSKVSAKALSINVKVGDYVERGQVLLNLDKTDLNLAYEQALAGYNSAMASYNAVAGSTSQQSKAQANQALVSAQTAYDQAKLNLDREQTLYDNASNLKIAQQTYDDAKTAYDMQNSLYQIDGTTKVALDAAYSQMMAAEENLNTVKTTLSVPLDAAKAAFTNAENALNNAKANIALTQNSVSSSVDSASAAVASARVAVDMAANNLKNTTLTAPISGYVSKCTISEGQMVAPGVELFSISNTNTLNAQINVSESDVGSISVGSKASVKIASVSKNDFEGIITVINPVKDAVTGLYNVRITLENTEGLLKAGMLCDVNLILAAYDNIIKVPSEAIINSNDEYFVYIAGNDSKAKKIKVELGIADEEFTEIVSGLAYDDRVIVSGKDYLSEKNNEINITGEYNE